MKIKKIVFVTTLLILSYNFFSQNKLPLGYKSIKLGMSLDDTKQALIKDTDFGYHGDRDVSLIPGSEKVLIETDAISKDKNSYFTRCWFQFYNNKLYTITLNINTKKIDYYSMFTTLSNKYGNPNSLDPQKATWTNDDVTLILEKPLSIKYIDNHAANELATYSTIEKAAEEITKQMFLDEF